MEMLLAMSVRMLTILSLNAVNALSPLVETPMVKEVLVGGSSTY